MKLSGPNNTYARRGQRRAEDDRSSASRATVALGQLARRRAGAMSPLRRRGHSEAPASFLFEDEQLEEPCYDATGIWQAPEPSAARRVPDAAPPAPPGGPAATPSTSPSPPASTPLLEPTSPPPPTIASPAPAPEPTAEPEPEPGLVEEPELVGAAVVCPARGRVFSSRGHVVSRARAGAIAALLCAAAALAALLPHRGPAPRSTSTAVLPARTPGPLLANTAPRRAVEPPRARPPAIPVRPPRPRHRRVRPRRRAAAPAAPVLVRRTAVVQRPVLAARPLAARASSPTAHSTDAGVGRSSAPAPSAQPGGGLAFGG